MSEFDNRPTKQVVQAGLPAIGAALAMTVLVLLLYLWIPVPEAEESILGLLVGMAVVGFLYLILAVWAVGRIKRAKYPLRAGMTLLGLMVTAIVVLFALTYLTLSTGSPGTFNVPLDKVSALYFTMTILTTVGFGDIHAVTHAGMVAVMIQMVVSLTLITTVARVLVSAARQATRARMDEQQG